MKPAHPLPQRILSWPDVLPAPRFHLVGFASSGDAAEPDDGLAVLQSLVENDVRVAFNCLLLIFWSFVVLLQLLPLNGL